MYKRFYKEKEKNEKTQNLSKKWGVEVDDEYSPS